MAGVTSAGLGIILASISATPCKAWVNEVRLHEKVLAVEKSAALNGNQEEIALLLAIPGESN